MNPSRILAVYITSEPQTHSGVRHALDHLQTLAKTFNKRCHSRTLGKWTVHLCYEGDLTRLLPPPTPETPQTLCVGPIWGTQHSIYDYPKVPLHQIQDRFLHIRIHENELEIQNDIYGAIPIFYTSKNGLHLSNIEPCVVAGSQVTPEDIDPNALGILVHFSHLLWDETLFKPIKSQEPDSNLTVSWRAESEIKFTLKPSQTIQSTSERHAYSDQQVAHALCELNSRLVTQQLGQFPYITLPLSGGYDSRMIFCALAHHPTFSKQLHCFTYGSPQDIDVKLAQTLCQKNKIPWQNIQLPFNYLNTSYLTKNDLIFGSSTHPHSMYQLEFVDTLKPHIPSEAVITSGFMTGVPGGQHLGMMDKVPNASWLDLMNLFGQSSHWPVQELCTLSPQFTTQVNDFAQAQLEKAASRLVGPKTHQFVILDLWTRQRNFISYYPRGIEWEFPCLSPHVHPEYLNFFLSLHPKHLHNRLSVELMLMNHYPTEAHIPANSNGVKSLSWWVPQLITRNLYIEKRTFFDVSALRKHPKTWFFPIQDLPSQMKPIFNQFLPKKIQTDSIQNALTAPLHQAEHHYERILPWQSLAFTLLRMSSWQK